MTESMHPACQYRSDKPWLDKQFHDIEKTSIKKPDELISEIQDPKSTIDEKLLDRILGSMIGLLLGDALGAHAEFRPYEFLKANPVITLEGGGTWGLKKGQFTDDTSMALCLANSLIARHGFVPYDQLVRYKWWHKHGYMSSTGVCFDIGSATSESIGEFEKRQIVFANEKKIPLDQLDYLSDKELLGEFNVYCSQEGVAGNGALMRLAPVPLYFHRDPKMAVQYSGISGQITHGDQKAKDACRYFGALIVAILQGEMKNNLLSPRFYDDHKDWFNNEPLHPDVQQVVEGSFKRAGGYEDGIRGKGYIISALEAALWAFWNDEESFEKGALAAVNLGDDTDTTAAIYGALAGTCYGYANLPQKWLDDVYAKQFIICLCKWITYDAENLSADSIPPKPPSSHQNSIDHHDVEVQPIIISKPTEMPLIQRTAIDPLGTLGSLYNGCQDRLMIPSDMIFTAQQLSVPAKTTKSFVKKGNPHEILNILEMIDITHELRLSLKLNITTAVGIAKVIDYSLPIDAHTRFLYYHYLDRENSLPDHAYDISRSILSPILKTQATHIVTGVSWGIEVLAILQIPADDASDIDRILNQICQHLTNNTTDLVMTSDQKRLLAEINRTTIYSNIHEITKVPNILDLYHKISDVRVNRTHHSPLTYKLCPIRYLYPEYSENDVTYIALEPQIIEKIEQYFLRSSFQFNTLKKLLEHKSFQSSDEYLCQQFLEAQNQFSNLKTIYKNEKKTFRQWVIDVRQGKTSPNVIPQELTDDHENKLKESINDIITRLNHLKNKEHSLEDQQTNIEKQPVTDEQNINSHNLIDDTLEKHSDRYSPLSSHEYEYTERPLSNSNKETINILLLGEIGVGKSTFINAFANYYSFDTLDRARLHEPVVVIPTSFLMTTQDWSVTPINVRVGTSNSNEIYNNNNDQTTTQQCQSYLFHMHDGTNVRFIDTPGLGDMRDLNQDYLQMQNILSFINNLPHLNAVCLLLKPNFSRFSVYEFCFQRLFNFFGDDIFPKIIFCFTHAFSTRFDSSDGIRLFESNVKSIVDHGIRMTKENTFHFDSESFRYLAAVQNSIEFDYESMNQVESSWLNSQIESIRFLRYIQMQLIPFQMHKQCHSIQHAQIEIQYMIRPMLETMRNILRNHMLWSRDSSYASIELCPKAISPNVALCLSKRSSYCDRFGKFWIRLDTQHKSVNNRCYSNRCGLKRPVPIEYQLDYKFSLDPNQHHYTEMADIHELIKSSAYFANFLLRFSKDLHDDPFLSGIERMIYEESFICSHYQPNDLNLDLYLSLKDVKRHYQRDMETIRIRQSDRIDLFRIDEQIKHISRLPMMHTQMNAVKQSRELFMIEHERQVSLKK